MDLMFIAVFFCLVSTSIADSLRGRIRFPEEIPERYLEPHAAESQAPYMIYKANKNHYKPQINQDNFMREYAESIAVPQFQPPVRHEGELHHTIPPPTRNGPPFGHPVMHHLKHEKPERHRYIPNRHQQNQLIKGKPFPMKYNNFKNEQRPFIEFQKNERPDRPKLQINEEFLQKRRPEEIKHFYKEKPHHVPYPNVDFNHGKRHQEIRIKNYREQPEKLVIPSSDWIPINAPAGALPAKSYDIPAPDLSQGSHQDMQQYFRQQDFHHPPPPPQTNNDYERQQMQEFQRQQMEQYFNRQNADSEEDYSQTDYPIEDERTEYQRPQRPQRPQRQQSPNQDNNDQQNEYTSPGNVIYGGRKKQGNDEEVVSAVFMVKQ